MSINSGIYCILNIKNRKTYIGSAVVLKRRWRQHKNALNAAKHFNRKLQRAWNKYGEENFEFLILEICNIDLLINKEQIWIDKFDSCKNGYNCRAIAEANRGSKLSRLHKKRIGESCKGRVGYWNGKEFSKEHKKKLSVARKGRQPNKNKKFTEEHKRKISEARKGKKLKQNKTRVRNNLGRFI